MAGKAARHLGHLLRRTLGDDEAAGTAASGPRSMMWSAHLMRSRFVFDDDDGVACIHQLLQYLDEAVDISHVEAGSRLVEDIHGLTRAAAGQLVGQLDTLRSPPERVVALCPSVTYPRPTSNSVCSLRAIFGWLAKKTTASSTVMFSTSEMVFSLYLTSSVSQL